MTKYKNSLLSSSSLNRTIMVATLAGAMAVPFGAANAIDPNTTPSGGNVVGGQADISKPANNVLNVNQHSNRAVIDWQSFNIGENARAEFFQPGSSSLAVNRVVGGSGDPTKILGQLKANGRLMVLDQNGIFFGKNSVIDTNGIIASTGTVSTDQVMNGADKIELSNFGSGEIVMKGTVNVADAGLAAFVSPTVKNHGVINARLGKVAFGAGSKVTVDLYGDQLIEIAVDDKTEKALLENTGQINAQGGSVALTVNAAKGLVDNVINMEGVTTVSSVEQVGGKIVLKGGDSGNVRVAGELDASGKQGGGEIEISGENTFVSEDAQISADATENGDGGDVLIWGDNASALFGTVSARGGANGGDGGFVELSALNTVGFAGIVDTSAANGETGTFLIDPENINIGYYPTGTTAWDLFLDTVIEDGGLDTLRVDADALAATLFTSNVNLWATNSINTVGNQDIDLSTHQYDQWEQTGSKTICFFGCVTFPTFGWVTYTEITGGDLTLSADTININNDVIMGDGGLYFYDIPAGGSPLGFGLLDAPQDIAVDTVNLDAKILSRSEVGGATSVIDRAKTGGQAHVVNVLSDDALIQQGIDFADSGADVNVAAGTYNENIVVDKTVSLYGANSGTAGYGSRGDESTVNPNSPGFYVTADGVLIDGFEIDGGHPGIELRGADNVTIRNNYIHSQLGGNDTTDDGIRIYNSQNLTIDQNWIDNVGDEGIYGKGNIDGLSVTRNVVENTGQTAPGTLHTIELINARGDATFENNVIRANGPHKNHAFRFKNSNNLGNITIFNNSVTGYDANGGYAVYNDTNATINASGNWWGIDPRNAPDYDQAVADVMQGTVDFTPMLVSGTDKSSANGFQGDFSKLFVTAKGAQTQAGGRINEAIGLVSGSTVYVGAGNFIENVVIDKHNLNLLGGYGGTSTIAPSTSGAKDAAIYVERLGSSTRNVEIDNFTIDGANVGYGVLANDVQDFDLTNMIVKNTSIAGFDIKVDHQPGQTVTDIENNDIDGSNTGDGIRISGDSAGRDSNGSIVGAEVNLTDNTIGEDGDNIDGKGIVFSTNLGDADGSIADAGGRNVNDVSINITGNDVYSNGNAVEFTGSITGADVNISNNNDGFVSTNGDGILFNKAIKDADIDVTGNIIGADKTGVNFNGNISDNADIDLTNNTIGSDGDEVLNGILFSRISNSQVNITNGSIDSAGGSGAIAGDGINFRRGLHNGANVVISGVTIKSKGDEAIDYHQSIRNGATAVIAGGTYEGGNNGVEYSGAIAGNATIANNAQITGFGSDKRGVNLLGPVTGSLTIAGNTIKGGDDAIGSNDKQNNHVNGGTIVISGNSLEGINGDGVELGNLSNATVTVSGNPTITAGDNGINITGTATNSSVTITSNNDGISAGTNGILFAGTVTGGTTLIASNIIDAGTNGIAFTGGTDGADVDILENDNIKAGENGILVEGEHLNNTTITLNKNRVRKAENGAGIYVADTTLGGLDLDITRNSVWQTGTDGIFVDTASSTTIDSNNIGYYGSGLTPVKKHKPYAKVIGDEGIDVNNSPNVSITNNHVTKTESNGISLNPSDFAEIVNNEVFGAAGNGINVIGGQGIRIDNNNVAAVLGHGIFTDGAYGLSVLNNDVLGTGQDGIHIVNAYGPVVFELPQDLPEEQGDEFSEAPILSDIPFLPGTSHHLRVDGNEVALTVGHGIYINGANTTDVTNNVVFATGLASVSEGTPITIEFDGPDGIFGDSAGQEDILFQDGPEVNPEPIGFTFEVGFNGDDIENETMTGNGIHVENVSFGDERPFEPADAGEEAPAFTERAALNITGNDVSYTGGHGIFAGNNRETFMEGNDVDHAGISSATVEFATGETTGDIDPLETIANKLRQILGYDSDGLSVTKAELKDLRLELDTEGPFINDITNDLDEVEKSGLKTRILEYVLETTPNGTKDGFHVQNTPTLVADNNVATNSGDDGFDADNISAPETLILTNNLFVNNGGSGVEISNTPSTELRNNLLLNNGANGLFMQGANNGSVVLTGNAIVDNPIGARFESGAIDLTDLAGFNTFDGGVTAMQLDNAGSPGDLTFVGNTLGNTIFSGQSGFYVQLQGGTLFQPGTPTIINGIGATYDGLRPLDLTVPGILTVAQLNAIEAKLFDFDDPGSRGQIFAGSLPGVDQENILANAIENFLGFGNNLTVTVTGFPTTIPGAGTQALTGGPITAAQAAGLEPAAGGNDEEDDNGSPAITYANCWAEVTSGGSYNLDFGSNPVSLMQAVTRCGQVVE